MKTFFTLVVALGVSSFAYLQTTVTNPGFELWSNEVVYDSLDMWTSSAQETFNNGYPANCVHNNLDPQDGTYSIYLETIIEMNPFSGMDDTIFGYVVKESAGGAGFTGFPYTDTVDQFTFWYKCDVMPGDSAIAIIQLSKGGLIYAQAVQKMGGNTSTWTQATVPIPFGGTDEPDSLWIGFASSDPFVPGAPDEGSELEIDLVELQYTAGSTIPSAIPNNSFESWVEFNQLAVDFWGHLNNLLFLWTGESYVNQSTDATNGNFSVELIQTAGNFGTGIPSMITNGEIDLGFGMPIEGDPFYAQPDRMLLDFQYTPSGVDTAFCWVQAWNIGGSLVDTIVAYPNLVTAWLTDTIELSFSAAPDSINVTMFAGMNIGSTFKFDHIRFQGGDLGVNTIYLSDQWNVFPNPSNEIATVVYKNADRLSVLNMAGQVIYSNSTLTSNQHQLKTSDWAEGVYLIQLENNGKLETKKLVVTH
jgi:hypothetical protein